MINGKKAYPSVGTNIKLTLENPFVKSSGNHTMQVSFPLAIPENRAVFNNIDRIDVSKRKNLYEDCSLYCSGIILLRGSGTLMSFSDKEVKLQLLGTSADVKAKSEDLFIDEIDYPEINDTCKAILQKSNSKVDVGFVQNGYGGVKGEYVFFTVVNDTNGKKVNRIRSYNNGKEIVYYLKKPVLQVNLMFVLKHVLRKVGYELDTNNFNVVPWNCLYIVNLTRSMKIARCLPHWKISTFLEEFRKLFNAVFVYDDIRKRVSILSYSEIKSNDKICYEHEDSFSSDYDEEGISYMGSDNIKYDLVECSDQKYIREISEDIFDNFEIREYDSLEAMHAVEDARTRKERAVTFYKIKNLGYGYFRVDSDTAEETYQMCGFFDMLVKEGNTRSSNATELKMVPVPIGESFVNESEIQDKCMMPCMEGPENWGSINDEAEDIITVQDVIEDDMEIDKTEEDEHIFLAFLAEKTDIFNYDNRNDRYYGILRAFADMRESNIDKPWTLALNMIGGIQKNIGRYHSVSATIDSHNQHVINFICDEIPDPKKIYMFNNKPFLCSKIDISLNENGVDRLMTGYFFEIVSSL